MGCSTCVLEGASLINIIIILMYSVLITNLLISMHARKEYGQFLNAWETSTSSSSDALKKLTTDIMPDNTHQQTIIYSFASKGKVVWRLSVIMVITHLPNLSSMPANLHSPSHSYTSKMRIRKQSSSRDGKTVSEWVKFNITLDNNSHFRDGSFETTDFTGNHHNETLSTTRIYTNKSTQRAQTPSRPKSQQKVIRDSNPD